MLVLVCGSRDWEDPAAIASRIGGLAREHRGRVTVLHGGARGADMMADAAARRLGLHVREERAHWSVGPDTPPERVRRRRDGTTYDVGRGRERNLRMLELRPDLVLAFQRAGSTGTQHTIDEVLRRGVPVEVLRA